MIYLLGDRRLEAWIANCEYSSFSSATVGVYNKNRQIDTQTFAQNMKIDTRIDMKAKLIRDKCYKENVLLCLLFR